MNTEQQSEEQVDEAIEETFPASDPPANTVQTGVHIAPVADEDAESQPDRLEEPRQRTTIRQPH
jgi:hypothetical protein